MPGKHNAGGCGCCSDCACEVQGVSITGTGDDGDLANGTFLMTPVYDSLLDYCEVDVGVAKNGSPLGSESTPAAGPNCAAECEIAFTTVSQTTIGIVDTMFKASTYGFGTPYCRQAALVVTDIGILLKVEQIGSSSRITVTIIWQLREYMTEVVFPSTCRIFDTESGTLTTQTWKVTDTYVLDGDCSDGADIPHSSREVVFDGSGTEPPGTDDTQIVWGLNDSDVYTLFDPVEVALVA